MKKHKKLVRMGKNIIITLLMILSFICCYFAISSKRQNGIPKLGDYIPIAIQSNSMKGVFGKGDLILSKSYTQGHSLQIGDIITYYTIINGKRVVNTHTIIAFQESETGQRMIETKGVNNLAADERLVQESEIIGIYAFHIPLLGQVISFMQTRFGFFVCILFPLAVAFLVQLLYTIVQYAILRKDIAVQNMKAEYDQEIRDLKLQMRHMEKRHMDKQKRD
ncbi:signal peptidase I [Anaerosporobacter faecicola]|uniref:signal peptidase I n=1 Tax=Anaerosporobacter faecicola TaxID=2718714 RepID=UPI00143B07C5|nr:signal peptidase I [Anaerosporobacter faecicola]